ncbi:DNA cytosine methyltransferase [Brevibacillus borstelensis]|uniref:DNA cytosine methyltransferase n=1 Tax=Brevibacillus borstelensis TaxID=45462 RepID=UPI003CF5D6CB
MTRTGYGQTVRFIDLFCGIGGFRTAAEQAIASRGFKSECVFSSDIDVFAQKAYEANYGEKPVGDITKVNEKDIPDHDLLLAGFPCQPFSIIGEMKGLEDTRGTLFFDIARILKEKKPQAFILENVKQLAGHDKGRTMKIILSVLTNLGYTVEYKVLNALNFGLPQKRERVFIVGYLGLMTSPFPWMKEKLPMKPLSEILEQEVSPKHYVSESIRKKRLAAHTPKHYPSIWHENKSKNITSYPYSCALRANASYNYLLVNGERRLTPREMLRLQGFPDSFKIVVSDAQTRKQAGNSLPIPVARSVIEQMLDVMYRKTPKTKKAQDDFIIREVGLEEVVTR